MNIWNLFRRKPSLAVTPPKRTVERLAPEPTPAPEVMAAEMKAYHAAKRAEDQQRHELAQREIAGIGSAVEQANAVRVAHCIHLALASTPPGIKTVIRNGVETARRQDATATLWEVAGWPLMGNPSVIDPAWKHEMMRRINALFVCTDDTTLDRIQDCITKRQVRIDITILAPDTAFVWQRMAKLPEPEWRRVSGDIQKCVAIMLARATGLSGVTGIWTRLHLELQPGVGGWGFALVADDDLEAEVA